MTGLVKQHNNSSTVAHTVPDLCWDCTTRRCKEGVAEWVGRWFEPGSGEVRERVREFEAIDLSI